MNNLKFNKNNFENLKKLCCFLIIITVILVILCIYKYINLNNKNIHIENKLVRDKFHSLKKILGKPNYVEIDSNNNMKTATWMSPLDNFHDMGKYGGCDVIKIHGNPSKKFHPHPANVFLVVGKYIKVPEHLFGPLKFASETINIEQLFIPKKYVDKYYKTGIKELALVTGSCASVTISAITVQFVIDMINKYKDVNKSLELYNIFREEYDRRIDDYLCGRGITDKIDWYDHTFFEEGETANLGSEKCNSKIESFSHYPECSGLMENENFCKENPSHKCC